MGNLNIYNQLKTPPEQALEPINGGRLSGKTSINPQWRISKLTETFGVVGFGWKYEIVEQWLDSSSEAEISANVKINLYVKVGGEWSEPIPGVGGSKFQTKERNGIYVSDECYKMALTDAISVAGKALGLAGDIYWEQDESKYGQQTDDLSIHSLFAVRRRIEEKITQKVKNGMDITDIFASLNIKSSNQKQLDRAWSALQWLDEFEKELNRA